MTLSRLSRPVVVLASTWLSACVLDYQVGKNPQATATDDSGPSTTTMSDPAVCGDGVVSDDEACDDGNDAPDDGCDLDCRPTAVVEWTRSELVTGLDPAATAVAVDPTGRIVVAGMVDNQALVFVLDPAGNLVWKHTGVSPDFTYAHFSDVVVDADGRIFAAGVEGIPGEAVSLIQGFDPDGQALWKIHDPAPEQDGSAESLALGPGGLYSAGGELQSDGTEDLIVRRHDLATGAVTWEFRRDGAQQLSANDITVSGDRIVAVGHVLQQEGEPSHPLVVVLDEEGELVSIGADEQVDGTWLSVAAIGDAGDLLLVGLDADVAINGFGALLRRVDATGAEKWSFTDEETTEQFRHVGVGPDEAIVLVGTGRVPDSPAVYSYVRRLTGAGAPAWGSQLLSPEATREQGYAAAFGPGFIAAIGSWDRAPIGDGTTQDWTLWVRRIAAD